MDGRFKRPEGLTSLTDAVLCAIDGAKLEEAYFAMELAMNIVRAQLQEKHEQAQQSRL